MDRERPYNPEPEDREPRLRRAWKRSRLAGPVAGFGVGAAALLASGALADRSESLSQAKTPDVPEHLAPPDVTFYGEQERYVELFYRSYAIADEYWRSLGYGPSPCEEGMDVIFTRHFAGYDDPSKLPGGAIECTRKVGNRIVPSRRLWSNKDTASDVSAMSEFMAHELGHARGFRHTNDLESIMYSDDLENTHGKPPPSDATVENFERFFAVRMGF